MGQLLAMAQHSCSSVLAFLGCCNPSWLGIKFASFCIREDTSRGLFVISDAGSYDTARSDFGVQTLPGRNGMAFSPCPEFTTSHKPTKKLNSTMAWERAGHDRSPIRLTHTETVIRRSSLIGFLNSHRTEATMKPARNPSLTCPRLLASSTRAVSMYWIYVALLTWPIKSMSRNWTGRSMLNFNDNLFCDDYLCA